MLLKSLNKVSFKLGVYLHSKGTMTQKDEFRRLKAWGVKEGKNKKLKREKRFSKAWKMKVISIQCLIVTRWLNLIQKSDGSENTLQGLFLSQGE